METMGNLVTIIRTVLALQSSLKGLKISSAAPQEVVIQLLSIKMASFTWLEEEETDSLVEEMLLKAWLLIELIL